MKNVARKGTAYNRICGDKYGEQRLNRKQQEKRGEEDWKFVCYPTTQSYSLNKRNIFQQIAAVPVDNKQDE